MTAGAEIAAEVAAAIIEAGEETGAGPVVAYIKREGCDEIDSYPPDPQRVGHMKCEVIITSHEQEDTDGSNASEIEMEVLISPDIASPPKNDDVLVMSGLDYSIQSVKTVQPGGVPLLYKVMVARSA